VVLASVSVGVCVVFWFGLSDWWVSLVPVMDGFFLSSCVGVRGCFFRWFIPVFECVWSFVGCWLAWARCRDGVLCLVLLGSRWFLLVMAFWCWIISL